ncbi:ABC transporter substrate-binding protein [Candidatus Giovannonibacteria bacterium]|nr:ABC transporter substrate-binding protein [Candidatus Giovannonibacteria bacterium]
MSLLKKIMFGLAALILIGAGYFYYVRYNQTKISPPQEKLWRIGFLLIDKDIVGGIIPGSFKEAMKGLGYVEEKNTIYTIKEATGGNAGLLDKYAEELDNAGLDVIIVGATSSARPFKKIGLKTPIFVLGMGDPTALVGNPAKPEGLITGIGEGALEFNGKRLELLKQIKPTIKKVVSIVDTNHSNTLATKASLEKPAKELGLEMTYLEISDFSNPKELLEKLPKLTNKLGDAYISCACPSGVRNAKEVTEQLKKEKMPSISGQLKPGAEEGFLASYSDQREELVRLAVSSVDQILKGTPVSGVPVKFVTTAVLELNEDTAKAIGVSFSEAIKQRASKIYGQ